MNKFVMMLACVALANVAFASTGTKTHPKKASTSATKKVVVKKAIARTGDITLYGRPASYAGGTVSCGAGGGVCAVIKDNGTASRVNVVVYDEGSTKFSAYETYEVTEGDKTTADFEEIGDYVP